MRSLFHFTGVICALLALVACASDGSGDGVNTSSSALTAEEQKALDQCIADIAECRKGVKDAAEYAEKCRAIAECLPERSHNAKAGVNGHRRFCEAVEERCSTQGMDQAECDKLMERCLEREKRQENGESAEADSPQVTKAECLVGCKEAGLSDDICSERCSELD